MNEKNLIKLKKNGKRFSMKKNIGLREKGTEYPHTGKYNLHFENGVYNCNGCKTPLLKVIKSLNQIVDGLV